MDLSYQCSKDDLSRIPKHGPVVIVANHPFGLADPLILGALLSKVRSDMKFLANSLLTSVEELRHLVIPVNPFGGPESVRENYAGLRDSLRWLRNGGVLVVFPAGEVSAFQFPEAKIADRLDRNGCPPHPHDQGGCGSCVLPWVQ